MAYRPLCVYLWNNEPNYHKGVFSPVVMEFSDNNIASQMIVNASVHPLAYSGY